jgi:hypothetical protein
LQLFESQANCAQRPETIIHLDHYLHPFSVSGLTDLAFQPASSTFPPKFRKKTNSPQVQFLDRQKLPLLALNRAIRRKFKIVTILIINIPLSTQRVLRKS